MNLAGVRTERRELDDALAAAREGLPLLQEAGYAWNVLDHLALRAALADKLANAARIAGYTYAQTSAGLLAALDRIPASRKVSRNT